MYYNDVGYDELWKKKKVAIISPVATFRYPDYNIVAQY